MTTSLRLAFLLLLGSLTGLLSCQKDHAPCPPLFDNLIQVRFTAPTSQSLTELTILDLQSPTYRIRRDFVLARDRQEIVYLPVDLNARQTRCTFRLANRVDTLVVNYDFSTRYAGRKCGYFLTPRRPTGRPLAQSTVGAVETAVQVERAFSDTATYGRFSQEFVQLKVRIRL